MAHGTPLFETESPTESEVAELKEQATTDPTIAHAGLTEIDQGATAPLINGQVPENAQETTHAVNAGVAEAGSNAAGERQWDTGANGNDMTMSQEWVNVKAPVENEAEAASGAAPARATNTQSWADDQPEAPAAAAAAAAAPAATTTQPDANDGFHQVQRNRGRGDREGGYRGGRGGERGGHRGRGGYRGDGRGRGRGRGRGGPRRGGDES